MKTSSARFSAIYLCRSVFDLYNFDNRKSLDFSALNILFSPLRSYPCLRYDTLRRRSPAWSCTISAQERNDCARVSMGGNGTAAKGSPCLIGQKVLQYAMAALAAGVVHAAEDTFTLR